MNITQMLQADSPWLADLVYPLLALSCTCTFVLSLGWYFMPPRPRHPLNLVLALIAGSMILPAVLASMATGTSPYFDIVSIRTGLRLAWLGVGISFCWPVLYYALRFWSAWQMAHCGKPEERPGHLRAWFG